jgi:hypothetical protein
MLYIKQPILYRQRRLLFILLPFANIAREQKVEEQRKQKREFPKLNRKRPYNNGKSMFESASQILSSSGTNL